MTIHSQKMSEDGKIFYKKCELWADAQGEGRWDFQLSAAEFSTHCSTFKEGHQTAAAAKVGLTGSNHASVPFK